MTHHLAPPALRPRALPERYVEMRRMDPAALDPRRALASLPPLVKGYLRLGGFVGDGAVIDPQFNTTDVAIVVKTDLITQQILSSLRTAGSRRVRVISALSLRAEGEEIQGRRSKLDCRAANLRLAIQCNDLF